MGLPSPAAGGTLATYYWFSQTPLYQQTGMVDLPWQEIMLWLMIILAFLMVSNVPYPAWPKVGLRSWRAFLGLVLVLAIVLAAAYFRRSFFFPFGIAYVGYGLARALVLGMWERRPGGDAYGGDVVSPELAVAAGAPAHRPGSGGYAAAHEDVDAVAERGAHGHADGSTPRRRRRRRGRGGPTPPLNRPIDGPNE
jgi:CDP-diacylglycerol--serine O-phosphatidyltransferase